MRKSTYSWTESQVTASQKRALRLAKEDPDKKAIETVGVEATADRKVFSKNSKPKPLLQVHGH